MSSLITLPRRAKNEILDSRMGAGVTFLLAAVGLIVATGSTSLFSQNSAAAPISLVLLLLAALSAAYQVDSALIAVFAAVGLVLGMTLNYHGLSGWHTGALWSSISVAALVYALVIRILGVDDSEPAIDRLLGTLLYATMTSVTSSFWIFGLSLSVVWPILVTAVISFLAYSAISHYDQNHPLDYSTTGR